MAIESFNSIATGASLAAQDMSRQKLYGTNTVATILSKRFPSGTDWPMIELPGYVDISSSIAALTGSDGQATAVVVSPDQIADFEAHAKDVFERDGRPETAGYSDFGFGVWKPDKVNDPKLFDDGRIHDTTGEVSYSH